MLGFRNMQETLENNMPPVYWDTEAGLILILQLRSTLYMSYSIAATHVLRPACNIKAETDNVLPHRISFTDL